MSLVKKFPIDVLKIDRSFVREVTRDSGDRAIADAIIALGRALDLTIVAEGVETAAGSFPSGAQLRRGARLSDQQADAAGRICCIPGNTKLCGIESQGLLVTRTPEARGHSSSLGELEAAQRT